MKKNLYLLAMIFIIVFSSTGCSGDTKTTSVRKLYDYKSSDITRIEFVDTAIRLQKQPLVVNSKKKISEFLGYLDKLKLEAASEKDTKIGWTYQAILFNNDKEIVSITFGNPLVLRTYNDKTQEYSFQNYFPVKNEITPKQIDNFLASVNSAWVRTKGDPNLGLP